MLATTNDEMVSSLAAFNELRCEGRRLSFAEPGATTIRIRSLESAPGHRFRGDECTESVCCLLTPMIIGWDAYYVPQWAYGHPDYFVFVSHDSVLDIEVRTPEMHEKALSSLRSPEWIKAY
jgi:hypothetical protein